MLLYFLIIPTLSYNIYSIHYELVAQCFYLLLIGNKYCICSVVAWKMYNIKFVLQHLFCVCVCVCVRVCTCARTCDYIIVTKTPPKFPILRQPTLRFYGGFHMHILVVLSFFKVDMLACTLSAYTGCPRRNVPDFGRVFLMLNYTDITQNT